MKIYHFTIIFAVFAIAMVVLKDMDIGEKSFTDESYYFTREAIEEAVKAAAWELRSSEVSFDQGMAKKAGTAFLYSIYAGYGIMDSPPEKEKIKRAFPAYVISVNGENHLYKSDWWKKEFDVSQIGSDTGFAAFFIGDGRHYTDPFSTVKSQESSVAMLFSAYVEDRKGYIVDKDGLNHEEGCVHCGEILYVMYSKKGCADMGARPCRYCTDR